jgi:hypothetical protein
VLPRKEQRPIHPELGNSIPAMEQAEAIEAGPCRACQDSDLPSPASWLRRGHVRTHVVLFSFAAKASSQSAVPWCLVPLYLCALLLARHMRPYPAVRILLIRIHLVISRRLILG